MDRGLRFGAGQLVFKVFEGSFHFSLMNVNLPQFVRRSAAGDFGSQEVAALPLAAPAFFCPIRLGRTYFTFSMSGDYPTTL
jgi:hypothetical protein